MFIKEQLKLNVETEKHSIALYCRVRHNAVRD